MSVWHDLRAGRIAIDYRKMLETVRRERNDLRSEIAWLDEREKQLLAWIEEDSRDDIQERIQK